MTTGAEYKVTQANIRLPGNRTTFIRIVDDKGDNTLYPRRWFDIEEKLPVRIRCIQSGDSGNHSGLTAGKIYEVYDTAGDDWHITDDWGEDEFYPRYWFEIVEE